MSSRDRRALQKSLKDRVNYSFLLEEYELKLSQIMEKDLNKDPDLRNMRSFVSWLLHSFPDDWKDRIYYEEIERSRDQVLVDVRPEISGLKLSPALCEQKGYPLFQVVEMWDPFKLHQAVINLWNRRGLLARVKYVELSTGRQFKEEGEVDLSEEDILGEFQD